MATQIKLGDISVEVVQKDIKNIHLSVYPPAGAVRISAPLRMNLDTIRVFAISKLGWIKQQQQKLREQERETPREYLDRESHYLWGKRYLLQIVKNARARVERDHKRIVLYVPAGAPLAKKAAVLDDWYRLQLKETAKPLIAKWEKRLGVRVDRFFVQRMKTKWGGSNPQRSTIRLNLELAKKPPQCLDYVILHEVAHFLVPDHRQRFVDLLDRHMPNWRSVRQKLNEAPLAHVEWMS